MIRSAILRIALALTAAAMPGCGAAPEAPSDAPLRKLRVGFTPRLSFSPIMIAQAEGYFRDEGLDVELVTSMRSEESLVALITGDMDVVPGPLHAGFLSAVGRGAPIRIVAGMGNLARGGCTYFGIVLRHGLDTAGTPVIKRMRAGQDGSSRYIASSMLAQRNVGIEGIETVRLPEAVLAMSLESGSIDAVATSEPALSRMMEVGTLWLSGEDALPDFQWGVVAFGDRLLVRERDTGLRFLRAFQRGVDQYRQGKTDRNVAILAQATGDAPEHIRAACWPEFSADSHVNWGSIEAFQAWAVAERHMEWTVTPEQAWDSSFVRPSARGTSTVTP